MKAFLTGALFAVALLTAAAVWLWYRAPQYLPMEWRRGNPNSQDYSPAVYRWKDDQGRTQVTDAPPADRPYETVTIDNETNVVPSALPTERDARRDRERD